MKGISHATQSALEEGSILEASLIPFSPLGPLPLTSVQDGNKKNPLTFSSKIKSSGYGSVKSFRPAWAEKSANRARGVVGVCNTIVAPPSYPAITPEMGREERDCWLVKEKVSAAMRGTSLSATGRVNSGFTEGGERVSSSPLSTKVLPCGAVFSLAFPSCGSALAASGSDGLFSLALSPTQSPVNAFGGVGEEAWTARLGSCSRHEWSPGCPGNLSFSAGIFPGLVPRLVQQSAIGASVGIKRSVKETEDAPPSRLLLGLLERGKGVGVWASGATASSTPLLLISSLKGDMGGGGGIGSSAIGCSGGGAKPGSAGGGFSAPATGSAFAYLDRLICVGAGRSVYVLNFSLGGEEGGDTLSGIGSFRRRGESRRYSCCGVWDLEDGVSVVSLAALNEARSPYLFVTCSDHTLRVFDLSRGGRSTPPEVLRCEAHTRAIHTLSLPVASCHTDAAPSSLDCVITASFQGGGLVRLWDIRSAKCSRELAGGHVSRSVATGAALSPCATFMAVGSEEKRTVLYDTRTSSVVSKLPGASDSVTAVAWHPTFPLLAAGSADSGVRFYTPL